MRIRTIPIFLLVVITACTYKSNYRKAAEDVFEQIPDTKNLNAGKQEYRLDVPVGWTTRHQMVYGIDYYFLSAPKTAADPNTNINVITERMQNLSLEVYVKKAIEQIKLSIPSAVILDEGIIETDSLKGAWYKYNMEPQGIKATLVSYIFPKDDVAYIITAGTQTKDADRYRNTFDRVARSFKFKD
ncbi:MULTISPECIES: hypothetical protein [unclassified Chitinophaga]|uniref:hypothetical protein n=1 Tax=unclassified Chitinophaga TaxID=2619133 RepID=UPI00300F8807